MYDYPKLPIIEAGGTKVVGESLIMDWPDVRRGVEQVLYNVLSEMVDKDSVLIKNKSIKVSCYRIRAQNLIRIDIRDVG